MDANEKLARQLVRLPDDMVPNVGPKSVYPEPLPFSWSLTTPLGQNPAMDMPPQPAESTIRMVAPAKSITPAAMPTFKPDPAAPVFNTGALRDARRVKPFTPQPIPELRTPTENLAVSSRRPRFPLPME
jgi:hypothetical protein